MPVVLRGAVDTLRRRVAADDAQKVVMEIINAAGRSTRRDPCLMHTRGVAVAGHT